MALTTDQMKWIVASVYAGTLAPPPKRQAQQKALEAVRSIVALRLYRIFYLVRNSGR